MNVVVMRGVIFSVLILLLSLQQTCSAKKSYSRWRGMQLKPTTTQHSALLQALDMQDRIDVLGSIRRDGAPVDVMVAPEHVHDVIDALDEHHMSYDVVHDDLQKVFDEEGDRLRKYTGFEPDDYNPLDFIYSQMEVWQRVNCPAGLTCTVYELGYSFEYRRILAMHVGTGKPVIFLDSLMHANEWLTAATNLKIMQHVLLGYGSDREVTSLLQRYDIVFVPVVNPDGYDYTWILERMWRKNRSDNGGHECQGVDLNRNFAIELWGVDSDTDPCSEYYHGPGAASEPETELLQREILRLQNEGPGIALHLNMHSYSSMWMFPWAHLVNGSCARTEDYDDLYSVSEAAQSAIRNISGTEWLIGTACEVIYPASGVANDWMREVAGIKYAYVVEMRGDCFKLDPKEIQPSFEEIWGAINAAMARTEVQTNARQSNEL